MADDILYRGTVTRLASDGAWVEVPSLATGMVFGPCHVPATPLKEGDPVLVGCIEGIDDEVVVIGRLQTAPESSGVQRLFKWKTQTTETDPTHGYVKCDNADPAMATELYVSLYDLTDTAFIPLSSIDTNDVIWLYESGDVTQRIKYKVTAPYTAMGGWAVYPVTVELNEGYTPSNNQEISVYVTASGAGGGGGTALTVQDENVNVDTAVDKIDFQGAGVTVAPGATHEVVVTIPGGGGSGLPPWVRAEVRVASNGNIASLSGLQTVDSVALAAGDRVLVKDQSTASLNGIYVVSTGAWTRATDANTPAQLTKGVQVRVGGEGTVNPLKTYTLFNNVTTVGTTNQTWDVLVQVDAGGSLQFPGPQGIGHVYYDSNNRVLAVFDGGGWVRSGVPFFCTSSTRPSATFLSNGFLIYETDTGQLLILTSGGVWKIVGAPEVYDEGTPVVNDAVGLNFLGAGVSAASDGLGNASVTVDGVPKGSAGGDLAGTYPNPTIGTGKVDSTKIASGSIYQAHIVDGEVTLTKLAAAAVSALMPDLYDEGLLAVSDVTSINFKGDGVSLAGAGGGSVEVTIPGSAVSGGFMFADADNFDSTVNTALTSATFTPIGSFSRVGTDPGYVALSGGNLWTFSKAGTYLVTATATFNLGTADTRRIVLLYHNGVEVRRFDVGQPHASLTSVEVTHIIEVAAGDTIQVNVWVNSSGVNLATSPGHKVQIVPLGSIGPGQIVRARMTKASQSVAASTTIAIDFDTTAYENPAGQINLTANSLTIPDTGTYTVVAYVEAQTVAGDGTPRTVFLDVDGAAYRMDREWITTGSAGVYQPLQVAVTGHFNKGQVLTVRVQNGNTGSAATFQNIVLEVVKVESAAPVRQAFLFGGTTVGAPAVTFTGTIAFPTPFPTGTTPIVMICGASSADVVWVAHTVTNTGFSFRARWMDGATHGSSGNAHITAELPT